MTTWNHVGALEVVTFGEVMAMFVARDPGPLEDVTSFDRALAGAEVNVATGLARLGHATGWVGRVGDDPLGRHAVRELRAAGIDTALVSVDEEAPTGFQLKSMAQGQDPEVVYFRRNSAGSRLAPSAEADAYVARARHLHVTGIPLAISETAREFAFRAIRVARAAGATVSFDPNLRPSLWKSQAEMVSVVSEVARLADWVLPGLGEGRLLTGAETAEGVAAGYLEAGVKRVVVKDGGFGATLFTADGSRHQPAFPIHVVDTVGAGDGFAAGFISGELDGLDPASTLARAAAVAALATTSPGDKDGLPDRQALADFLALHQRPALNTMTKA